MIDIKELRINNWIELRYPRGLAWAQVKKIDASEKVFTSNRILNSINDIDSDLAEPIPLTEELLLKCGFDENMVLSTIEGEIRYYGDGDINIGGEDSCTLGMVYIAKCKYLHQLQNLYFALTGEELEIHL